jgi:hypothetical protein
VAQRSLFQVLTEQPWWVSAAVTALVFSIGALFSPLIGAAAALPFFGMTCYVVWLRIRRGPTLDVPELLKALRAASAEELRAMLSEVYGRERYEIGDAPGGDLELQRNGYLTLVRYRRWRAQSTGAAALEELVAAMRVRNADRGVYLTAGVVTESARKHARDAGIELLDGAALARLLQKTRTARRVLQRTREQAVKS